jgi:hypothetical protein
MRVLLHSFIVFNGIQEARFGRTLGFVR